MKIIFSGGGTLGPVVPLLAVAEAIKSKYPRTECIWVGTKRGPEKEMVEAAGIPFMVIGAGKWRRYISLLNIIDLFKIIIAFFQSLVLLIIEKPDALISAGGFVSVPLHWAGWCLGVPAWVHQQDIEPGLANYLMTPGAKKITTAVQKTLTFFPASKAEWIGNPARDLRNGSAAEARRLFGIPAAAPVIFALGGGTGSASINKLILDALPHWPAEWHVIHLVGRERPHELAEHAAQVFPNYHVFQFFTREMKHAYALADIVIARAGFSTLTELASLSKAAIILPMFGTHQETNARFCADAGAIIMLEKGTVVGLKLAQIVKDLMQNQTERKLLGQRLHQLLPRAESEKIISIVENLLK